VGIRSVCQRVTEAKKDYQQGVIIAEKEANILTMIVVIIAMLFNRFQIPNKIQQYGGNDMKLRS